MSLTTISLFQSTQMKIFYELDARTCVKTRISNVFGIRRPKLVLQPIASLEWAIRKLFHELDVHHV